MALSDDQRAMLRLLAQREEGYDDIAALMGLSVDEVRAKVKEALEGLDDSSPAPKPAEPPKAPPKPAAPPPKPTPPAPPSASDDAPKAQKAKIESKPAQPARPPRAAGQKPQLKLPTGQGARLGILAGAVAAVLLVVLLVTGVFGSDSSSAACTPKRLADASINTKQVTGAILAPENDGNALGLAVLGRAGKEPLLQIEAECLEPAPEGETYTVWLYKSPKLALRAGAVKGVNEEGSLAAQLPIPIELVEYIAAGAFDQIYISLTPDAAYKAEVAAAKRDKRLPRYTGATALRGFIVGPLMNAASRQRGNR